MFEPVEGRSSRRVFWAAIPALGAIGAVLWPRKPEVVETPAEIPIAEFSDAGVRLDTRRMPKIVRSEAEWWSLMTPQQFYVTRNHSTDTPFTGTYYRMHEDGLFRCLCCETALFSSAAKYDSGSGWPSFWQPIAEENIKEVETAALSRQAALDSGIEVLCRRCDAHLGHIFGDGPEPTGLRYCINESSLRFVGRS